MAGITATSLCEGYPAREVTRRPVTKKASFVKQIVKPQALPAPKRHVLNNRVNLSSHVCRIILAEDPKVSAQEWRERWDIY
jgi:hypothetical protein